MELILQCSLRSVICSMSYVSAVCCFVLWSHTPVVRCAHLLFRWTYWVSDTLKSHDRLYTKNTASAGTAPQPPIPETHIPHCHQPHLPVYQIGACQENKQRYWTQILTQQCIYAIIYQMSKCSQCKCELYIHLCFSSMSWLNVNCLYKMIVVFTFCIYTVPKMMCAAIYCHLLTVSTKIIGPDMKWIHAAP